MIDVSSLTHMAQQPMPQALDVPRPVAPVQPVAKSEGAETGGARDSGKRPLASNPPRNPLVLGSDSSMQFTIDKDSDRLVVSLLDTEGEVIRQIPAEVILKIAERLEQIMDEGNFGFDVSV